MLKKKNLWRGLTMVFALLLAVSMMAGNILELYRTSVDAFLGTRSTQTVTEQSDDESDAWTYKSEFTTAKEAYEGFKDFAIETSQETFALLKNENGALPLAKDAKITMLGVRSYAPVYGNSGGSVPDGKSTVQIFDAFTERGFQLNPETLAAYEAFFADKEWTKPQFGGGILPAYAEISAYNDPCELTMDELKALNPDFQSKYTEYGDAAIVVVSRVGGEGGAYYPGEEGLAEGVHTVNGNILSLSDEEMAMIEEAKANFDKVIVLVNAANPMEISNLEEDPDIDAILWVGYPGAYGFYGVADVLNGTVAPSAHLGDTFVKNGALAPAMQNFGNIPWANASDFAEGTSVNSYLIENEGIYTGYRYYETRYADIVLGNGGANASAGTYANADGTVATSDGTWSYDNEVVYPFGYGMSYTTFEQTLDSVVITGDKRTATVTVTTTNTGDVAGKAVVQLYASAPYTDYDKQNGVEKAAVALVGFGKTGELAPGTSEIVTMNVNKRDIASYDTYGAGTYILDAGDYYFTAANDAHEAVNNILAAKGYTVASTNGKMTADGDADLTYAWTEDKLDTTTYSVSENGTAITNQLSCADPNLYDGEDNTVTWLSRSDWNGTLPTETVKLALTEQLKKDLQDIRYDPADYEAVNLPAMGKNNGVTLYDMIGLDYDDPKWDDLLDNLTFDEMNTLIGDAFHWTMPVKSIEAPGTRDENGPQGLTASLLGSGATQLTATAFTSEDVMAATFNTDLMTAVGTIIGNNCLSANIACLYGPGNNIHRTPYGGRNFEYYSEDGFLSGMMSAYEVAAIQEKGVHVVMKHFALNDCEQDRIGLGVWINEQAAREVYLKAFQAPIEVGNGNGVMIAYTRWGAVWSGGNAGLVNGILRGEWGCDGMVITDNVLNVYVNGPDGVLAGVSIYDAMMPYVTDKLPEYKNDGVIVSAMREACHHNLYAIANSCGMNGVGANTTIKLTRPTVITMVIIITCAAAFFCLLGIVLWIFGVRKLRKSEEYKAYKGFLKDQKAAKKA